MSLQYYFIDQMLLSFVFYVIELSCQLLNFILDQSFKSSTSIQKRKKTPFSKEEQEFIIESVRKYDQGQWSIILCQYGFPSVENKRPQKSQISNYEKTRLP